VSDPAATARVDPQLLAEALDAVPDGVAVFDADWTLVYVNQAGAQLLERHREELLGRNIWIALPELGGSIFHSFLLHARSVGERVTWQGFYVPADRWVDATAVRVGEALHVYFRESPGQPVEGAPARERLHDGDRDTDSDRLRYLAEVSESMISTLDTGESVATLVGLVVPRLCDWAVVTVLGDDGQPADAGRTHRDPDGLRDLDVYLRGRTLNTSEGSPLAAALLTGEPIHLPTIDPRMMEPSLSSPEVRAAWERLDAASFTMVPLRARGETFGVLGMVNSSGRPPHTEMEIAVAVEVVRRAALALDNTRLYGRQLQVAETLQRSLLTPPPQPDGLEIAVRYQPAATNMHVGGDWYDAFLQRDGGTLLVIGDVVGHNVDAAAAMGQVRSIVRGIAYDRQEGPAGVLGRVDEVLTGLRIGTLATALVARVEQTPEQAQAGERLLRWSSAGHLPPLVIRRSGQVEVLDTAPETLLGADSRRPRTDHRTLVHPDETVIFYTDGLVEHGRTSIDDGIARLTRLVAELAGASVDELCDLLLERIVDRRSDDDIAIVAVRCHPQDAVRSATAKALVSAWSGRDGEPAPGRAAQPEASVAPAPPGPRGETTPSGGTGGREVAAPASARLPSA
jgi:sigma-B regulation protein RsbU (phosphoserine phosphatase)